MGPKKMKKMATIHRAAGKILKSVVILFFMCPNLEKCVTLFVGSVELTFPFYFGSETSEKTSEKRMIFERI